MEPLKAFIAALPKVELHVHLIGSAPVDTVLELARRHPDRGVPADAEKLRDFYTFRDFPHFIDVYQAVSGLIAEPEDLADLVRGVGQPEDPQFLRRGLRLVCWDRPGYGGSTPQPGRTIADVTADAATVCAALGFERVLTWGISSGAPHALACAALLPDLVAAAASLASPAPYPAEGIGDYFAGMDEDNVEEIQLILADEAAAMDKHKREWAEMREVTDDDIAASMASLLTAVDAAVLSSELTGYFAFTMRDGLSPGPDGYWDDSLALVRPWGFELSAISVPVLLLHGRHDQFVPQSHGAWLAGQIPGVEARLLDDDGHLTLGSKHIGDVHAWLAEHL